MSRYNLSCSCSCLVMILLSSICCFAKPREDLLQPRERQLRRILVKQNDDVQLFSGECDKNNGVALVDHVQTGQEYRRREDDIVIDAAKDIDAAKTAPVQQQESTNDVQEEQPRTDAQVAGFHLRIFGKYGNKISKCGTTTIFWGP